MKQLKIIPISGGLDSTYLLYHYLKDTDYIIHAHHIILKSKFEPRWEEELKACKNIVSYCQNIRYFDYTESTWEFPFHCWDFEIVVFCCGQIARKITKPDTNISLTAGVVLEDTKRSSSGVSRIRRFEHIWTAVTEPLKNRRSLKLETPIMNLSKKDLLENMPEELSEMCWSCRHSDNGEPCGRCKACDEVKKAKDEIDHDMLVNKLTDER